MVLGKTGRVCRRRPLRPQFIYWGFFFIFILMLYRFIFFLFVFQSFSQEITFSHNYKIQELSNIGSPTILYFPNFSFNNKLKINYNVKGSRLVENHEDNLLYDLNILPNFNLSSQIKYISAYNEGGLIMCNLSRPVSRKSFLNFYYNNLSSLGFFQNQENKFSNLGFDFYSFNKDSSYIFLFSFNSINGFYEENGGVQSIDSDLSNDLMLTYLSSARIENKIRKFSFNQIFKIDSNNSIIHNFKYNSYSRRYTDPNPESFHYSLTPLDYKILNFSSHNYFNDIENSLTFSSNFFLNKKIDYSLTHYLYYHELIRNKNNGDFIFSISNFNNTFSNVNFSLSFCPSGYNKSNYDFRLSYKFDQNDLFKSNFYITLNKQKPDLFSESYDTGLTTDWENDFNSTNTFSFNFDNHTRKYDFDIKFTFKKISNLLYFNSIAAPVQFTESLNYFHFHLSKKWSFNKLKISQNIHFQKINQDNYHDIDVLSVPFFFYNQMFLYSFYLFKTNFTSSIDLNYFSKYFANAYMPINGVFYNQNQSKVGNIPILNASLFMMKNKFKIGVLIENIHSLFYDKQYIITDYLYNDLVFRLSVNWEFVD